MLARIYWLTDVEQTELNGQPYSAQLLPVRQVTPPAAAACGTASLYLATSRPPVSSL